MHRKHNTKILKVHSVGLCMPIDSSAVADDVRPRPHPILCSLFSYCTYVE